MPKFFVSYRRGHAGVAGNRDTTVVVRAWSQAFALAQFAPADWPVVQNNDMLIAYEPKTADAQQHGSRWEDYWYAEPYYEEGKENGQ